VQIKGLLCILLGHKWAAAEVNEGPEPLMCCQRCLRTTIFSEETRSKISLEQRIQPTDRMGNRLP
jgi:hypothetical protein